MPQPHLLGIFSVQNIRYDEELVFHKIGYKYPTQIRANKSDKN